MKYEILYATISSLLNVRSIRLEGSNVKERLFLPWRLVSRAYMISITLFQLLWVRVHVDCIRVNKKELIFHKYLSQRQRESVQRLLYVLLTRKDQHFVCKNKKS